MLVLFDAIQKFSKDYSAILSGASFVFGLLIGNWQAVGRDKRKDRIVVMQRAREGLLKARSDLRPVWPGLSLVDHDSLSRMLPWWRRSGFRRAAKKCHEARANCITDAAGGRSFGDPDGVAKAIDHLLRYVDEC